MCSKREEVIRQFILGMHDRPESSAKNVTRTFAESETFQTPPDLQACAFMEDVTLILSQLKSGEVSSESLLAAVYEELRSLARAKMAKERQGHTLQATALVHEAWMSLGENTQSNWENRRHFFGAAAEAMRRILVDHARKKQADKRGGGERRGSHRSS